MSVLRLGQDKKYLQKKAGQEGLTVFLPQPDEVFLDLDTPFGRALERENSRVLDYIEKSVVDRAREGDGQEGYGVLCILLVSKLYTRSQGGNVHAYLKFSRSLTDLERVIFQVCLGSDPIKEFFSFMQMKYLEVDLQFEECECPIALFETPQEAVEVEKWRKKHATA